MNALALMLNGLAWVSVVLLAIPVGVFSAEVLGAVMWWLRGSPMPTQAERAADVAADVAILIPAHNESAVIGQTLACLADRPTGMRVVVVADNCTDDTAQIARQAGAEVVERHDAERRGKGYALQHGIDYLRTRPAQVVIVVDADCLTTPTAMQQLADACLARRAPVQAWCEMRAPDGAGPALRVAELAWIVKTLVRPNGARQFGWPNHITGTGFALPWAVASHAQLASGHLVEDMQLTFDLAQQGITARLLSDVRLTSYFPLARSAQVTQRSRWEHGHLGMLVSTLPRSLCAAVRDRNAALLAIALDTAVPPLSLLVMLVCALVLLSATAWLAGAPAAVLLTACAVAASLMATVLIAWAIWGRQALPVRDLLAIPWFVVRKVLIYTRFLTQRETGWKRTDRN